jgi:hypothetical protein
VLAGAQQQPELTGLAQQTLALVELAPLAEHAEASSAINSIPPIAIKETQRIRT